MANTAAPECFFADTVDLIAGIYHVPPERDDGVLSYDQALYAIEVVLDMELLVKSVHSHARDPKQCQYRGYAECAKDIVDNTMELIKALHGEVDALRKGDMPVETCMQIMELAEEAVFKSTMAHHIMWHPDQAIGSLKRAQAARVVPLGSGGGGDHAPYTVPRRRQDDVLASPGVATNGRLPLSSHRKDWAVLGQPKGRSREHRP